MLTKFDFVELLLIKTTMNKHLTVIVGMLCVFGFHYQSNAQYQRLEGKTLEEYRKGIIQGINQKEDLKVQLEFELEMACSEEQLNELANLIPDELNIIQTLNYVEIIIPENSEKKTYDLVKKWLYDRGEKMKSSRKYYVLVQE